MGASVRGVCRLINSWKDPAQASRFVRKPGTPNRCFAVEHTLDSSNCESWYGPFGSWITVPALISGLMSRAVVRRPRRRKSTAANQPAPCDVTKQQGSLTEMPAN
eukprot:COSAG01_NODE_232_length_21016_cov_51.558876_8_plen_105_part_00